MRLSVQELTEYMQGILLQGDPHLSFDSFNIDSRLTQPGELFFAIQGERDGHAFVAEALSQGAAGAVVSREMDLSHHQALLIKVPDTLEALQRLAGKAAARIKPRAVGITGSVGKTTTKEFTARLLSTAFPHVLKSEGNFNNHLGLPLTLLRLDKENRIAVLEYGMSAPGEITSLTRILAPDVAVITNVRPVHMEFFPDLQEIARAKQELLMGSAPGAVAVLNWDDPHVKAMADEWDGPLCSFGLSPHCTVRAERIKSLGWEGFSLDLRYGDEKLNLKLPFFNQGQISNFLAAAAVARIFEVPLEALAAEASRLQAFEKRGRVYRLQGGIHVIDDSYNSNPAALEAAMFGLASLPGSRKLAALGDMLELGGEAVPFHRKAGELVAHLGIDLLYAVGPLSRHMAEAAVDPGGMKHECVFAFETSREAAEHIASRVKQDDVILVKGSRGIRMEIVVETLLNKKD